MTSSTSSKHDRELAIVAEAQARANRSGIRQMVSYRFGAFAITQFSSPMAEQIGGQFVAMIEPEGDRETDLTLIDRANPHDYTLDNEAQDRGPPTIPQDASAQAHEKPRTITQCGDQITTTLSAEALAALAAMAEFESEFGEESEFDEET